MLITAQLELQVSDNALKVPNKIVTGSEGNLMALYIFKMLCGNKSVEQLKRSLKSNIKIKTYNGTQIKQLAYTWPLSNSKILKRDVCFL